MRNVYIQFRNLVVAVTMAWRGTLVYWTLIFLIIAVVAYVLGLAGIIAFGAAEFIVAIFVILFVIAFVAAWLRRH
jgi:uncharacterized membrane protein YtjA (UPF0391 family)